MGGHVSLLEGCGSSPCCPMFPESLVSEDELGIWILLRNVITVKYQPLNQFIFTFPGQMRCNREAI